MGFIDKAKKLADQAQAKLDEVQKQFNEGQGSSGRPPQGAAPVEYDQHGRAGAARDAERRRARRSGDRARPAGDARAAAERAHRQAAPTSPDGAGARRRRRATRCRRGAPPPPKPPSSGSGMTSGDPLAG